MKINKSNQINTTLTIANEPMATPGMNTTNISGLSSQAVKGTPSSKSFEKEKNIFQKLIEN